MTVECPLLDRGNFAPMRRPLKEPGNMRTIHDYSAIKCFEIAQFGTSSSLDHDESVEMMRSYIYSMYTSLW